MTTLRLTFEVDTAQMFEVAHKLEGPDKLASIGGRLASAFLAPRDLSMAEMIGLGVYGVHLTGIEDKAETAAPAPLISPEERVARLEKVVDGLVEGFATLVAPLGAAMSMARARATPGDTALAIVLGDACGTVSRAIEHARAEAETAADAKAFAAGA